MTTTPTASVTVYRYLNGSSLWVDRPSPLAVGDTVRVHGYGFGARLYDCGRTGTVIRVNRTRVDVRLDNPEEVRAIGGICLTRIVQEV